MGTVLKHEQYGSWLLKSLIKWLTSLVVWNKNVHICHMHDRSYILKPFLGTPLIALWLLRKVFINPFKVYCSNTLHLHFLRRNLKEKHSQQIVEMNLQTLQKASGNYSNYPSPLEKLNVLQIFWKLTKIITYECHCISSYYYGHFIMGEGIIFPPVKEVFSQTLYTLKASITSLDYSKGLGF
jgi:hypothetical protein